MLPPSRIVGGRLTKLLTNYLVKAKGQPCKSGETAAQTGCTPAQQHWAAHGPKKPKFVSSNAANVAQNEALVAQLTALAQQGDAAGIQAMALPPSPKLTGYRDQLLAFLNKPHAGTPPSAPGTPTVPAAAPKPPQTAPAPALTPAAALGSQGSWEPGKVLAAVQTATGYTAEQLKNYLNGDASIANKEAAEARAKVASFLYDQNLARPNALLALLDTHDPATSQAKVTSLTIGNPIPAQEQFAETPLYDLNFLSRITQKSGPVSGEAVCNMGDRSITCGSTTRPGSYRHELGHALHAAWGGGNGYYGKTSLTKAVDAAYANVMQKVKANPAGMKEKKDYEFYETTYGAVGRRSLDNEKENAAEHYRLVHREAYRDRKEGGNGKFMTQYRQRHPEWARIFDAHYSTALLGQHLLGK